MLFAIDEAHALFQRSTYRAPDYSPLESYSLSAPLLAIDYLSGRKTFVRLRRPAIAETSQARGAVLTAPSHSTPYLDVPSILLAALDLPTPHPVTPYTRYDPHHLAHASSGIKKVEVPYGMTPGEAAGMFEIWAKKGWAPKGEAAYDGLSMLMENSDGRVVRGCVYSGGGESEADGEGVVVQFLGALRAFGDGHACQSISSPLMPGPVGSGSSGLQYPDHSH